MYKRQTLCSTQNEISARLHAGYVGRTLRVLVDGETDDTRWPLSARTAGGRLVHLVGDKSALGQYRDCLLYTSRWSTVLSWIGGLCGLVLSYYLTTCLLYTSWKTRTTPRRSRRSRSPPWTTPPGSRSGSAPGCTGSVCC